MLTTGLAGRACLVTGAAHGIGRACAELLAGERARVAIADHDGEALAATPADGPRVVADLATRAGVGETMAAVDEHLGGLDVLIHCAGVYRTTALPQVDDDEWDLVLDTNLRSSYLLCQSAVERMRDHGGGRIVLFGSFAARTGGLRASVAYAASKAGVEGVTRHVAAYAGPLGVRVNCVHPGLIHTPMTAVLTEAAREQAYAATPLGRGGEPREAATLAVVLASDLAAFVHGATVDVNGGMYMA